MALNAMLKILGLYSIKKWNIISEIESFAPSYVKWTKEKINQFTDQHFTDSNISTLPGEVSAWQEFPWKS